MRARLAKAGCKRFIYLAGDSSLDNKFWLGEADAPAINGYEAVLQPARMRKDVSYWLNQLAAERVGPRQLCTIMSSVEASTLADRSPGLLGQDAFIRDHLNPEDMVIVSVGGNDIALRPTIATVLNLMALLLLSPTWLLEQAPTWAPGFGHLARLFSTRLLEMVKELIGRTKPSKVVVCMIYYPQMAPDASSWASSSLALLDYDRHPAKLQLLIRAIFTQAMVNLQLPGTTIVPVPLFEVLNGSDPDDYEHRVEPSVQGGRKMAEAFLRALGET